MFYTFAAVMGVYIRLLRVSQWVKNLFLFIPAFFAEQIFQLDLLYVLLLGFFSYSFTASSIYIINDLQDVEKDRRHPEKKHRPIASGEVKPKLAVIIAGLSMLLGLGLALLAGHDFLPIPVVYIILNLAYSFKLKQIAILDIVIIALGFLLRVWAGGILCDITLSKWLIIMIFLLALFLAIAKRRDDLLILQREGHELRKSLAGYNLEFVNGTLYFLSAIIIVTYIQYTVSPEVMQVHQAEHLYLSSFFVVIGMLRYLQIALVEQKSGNPTKILLKDPFTQSILFGWAAVIYYFFYW